jgi:Holliday junction resolvase
VDRGTRQGGTAALGLPVSAHSRRKGASHEREVVNILKVAGFKTARNLDQTRDGGGDVPFGDYLLECKRRKNIAIYEWWDQVNAACAGQKKPALVVRADNRENLAIIRLVDFMELVLRGPDSMESSAD